MKAPKERKESFILYHSDYNLIKKLSETDQAALLKAIFEYEIDGKEPILDAVADVVFTAIRQHLDFNRIKYETLCKDNTDRGYQGGRPKKSDKTERLDNKPNGYFKKPNDNGNVNDSDSDSVSDNEYANQSRTSSFPFSKTPVGFD